MIRLETLIEFKFSIRAVRAQIVQFDFVEFIILLKLDKRFPVEQFEAAVPQSTVPSPPRKVESGALHTIQADIALQGPLLIVHM